MGISTNLVSTLADAISRYRMSGSLLMLGRQDIEPSGDTLLKILAHRGFAAGSGPGVSAGDAGGVEAENFFQLLGFSEVESLDVEEALDSTIMLDLNSSETPEYLKGRFDVIFDGGTLEHVFHLPNALARCSEMLKADGFIMHIGPMNNYVDHGFYQFSPTLWFDWLEVNRWILLESIMVRLPAARGLEHSWTFSSLPPGLLGTVGELDDAPYMHFFMARKCPGSRSDQIPWQSYYTSKYRLAEREESMLHKFETYLVVEGIPRSADPPPRDDVPDGQTRFLNLLKRLVRNVGS